MKLENKYSRLYQVICGLRQLSSFKIFVFLTSSTNKVSNFVGHDNKVVLVPRDPWQASETLFCWFS
jgi:hypothetical protein